VKRKRFSVEQIVPVLKQAEMGTPVADLIRHLGIAEQTFYRWKQRYAGLESEQVREFKQLQDENTKLKRLAAYAGRLLWDEYGLGACEDPEMAMHLSEGWLKDAEMLRETICSGEIGRAIELLGSFVSDCAPILKMRLLGRALPFLSPEQRVWYLLDTWLGSKQHIPARLALPLFRCAPLHPMRPVDWPASVTVYRGDCFLRGKRLSRRSFHKVSWTTDRAVAVRFATDGLGKIEAVWPGKGIPVVATAEIASRHVLAYIVDRKEEECIIDPDRLRLVRWTVIDDELVRAPN
jgi:putative transposase